MGSSDPTWRPEAASGRSKGFVTVVILAVLALLVGATVYLFVNLRATRQSLEQANQKIQTHEEQLAKLEGSVIRTSRQVEESASALRGEVSSTRGQIAQATRQVESQVLSKTQELAQKLQAEHKAQTAKVAGEVEQLKAATETKIGAVSSEVGSVKSEVTQTKSQLEKTIAELKSVKGDLGVQSGLIATNAGELAALKRLGERNYFEFDLRKTKAPQRIGAAVSLKLKNADTKRNRYTVEVVADDKVTEKKDRTINEPMQFYVAKARIPFEIVVNQVAKDRIVGYLATPKDVGR
jgi:small-conductance mechanosensitive channel